MEQVKLDVDFRSGQPVIAPNMSVENYEDLKRLLGSPQWKFYSNILKTKRDGFMLTLMPLDEPNKALKTLGIIVGIDLALRELGALVKGYEDKRAKLVERESKNSRQPPPKVGDKEKKDGR